MQRHITTITSLVLFLSLVGCGVDVLPVEQAMQNQETNLVISNIVTDDQSVEPAQSDKLIEEASDEVSLRYCCQARCGNPIKHIKTWQPGDVADGHCWSKANAYCYNQGYHYYSAAWVPC
jgi:hypothetical protein